MPFWSLALLVGCGISLGTLLAFWGIIFCKSDIKKQSRRKQVIIYVLVTICIILVGGILNGLCIAYFWAECIKDHSIGNIICLIMFGLLPTMMIFLLLGFLFYGIIWEEGNWKVFVVVLIISSIVWSIPIVNYNQNIETTTETQIKSTQERKLLYFNNLPVQEITGEIHGSFTMGTGTVSGYISTSDEIPYWYLNEKNEGKYDSATAKNSKLLSISNGEEPYVKIKL